MYRKYLTVGEEAQIRRLILSEDLGDVKLSSMFDVNRSSISTIRSILYADLKYKDNQMHTKCKVIGYPSNYWKNEDEIMESLAPTYTFDKNDRELAWHMYETGQTKSIMSKMKTVSRRIRR